MRPLKFKSRLIRPTDHGGWHFVEVAKRIGTRFEKKDGTRRVVCTINGSESFQCALLPSGEKFVVVVNKALRTKLKIAAGDVVIVEIKRDESRYGLPMPDELREVLNQDADGDKLFHALTPGKQRSLLYFIGKVKDIDRRIGMALILVEHLKRNKGRIDSVMLQQELKRPSVS